MNSNHVFIHGEFNRGRISLKHAMTLLPLARHAPAMWEVCHRIRGNDKLPRGIKKRSAQLAEMKFPVTYGEPIECRLMALPAA